MSLDEMQKISKEMIRIRDENLILIEKLTDPTIKKLILNNYKLIGGSLSMLYLIGSHTQESIHDIISGLKKIPAMIEAAPSDLANRINEMESVVSEELTRITEFVELLREIHEEESKNLEKLR